MELVDIGANLTHDSFGLDVSSVLAGARRAGVLTIIVTGSSVESSRDALALARKWPSTLYATAGVHPHHASDLQPETIDQLRNIAAASEVVAIGECGLDYFRNFSPPEAQIHAFRVQLELAEEMALPVFLHERDAHDDFIGIVSEFSGRLTRAVAHCFTGSAAALRKNLDAGMYIGITGWICDERRGQQLKDLVTTIPQDKLLIETDAPYLLPRNIDPRPASRRNEPKYLVHVLRIIADILKMDPAELARITTANARRFFSLPVDVAEEA